MQNSSFRTRITSLCRRIDPTCGFCMQNSDFWTRITSLYGSQTSLVIFCLQNIEPVVSELLVSMGPSPHVWFLDAKQRLMDRNNKSLWVPDITCRFVHAKQRDLHQNDKSIWVPAFICVFFNAKQRLYDQTYKTVWGPDLIYCFCMKTSNFWTEIACLYGS